MNEKILFVLGFLIFFCLCLAFIILKNRELTKYVFGTFKELGMAKKS